MKVTKRIQEYIEDEVTERMENCAELKAAEKAADEADRVWKIAQCEFKDKVESALNELAKKYNCKAINYRGEETSMAIRFDSSRLAETPARLKYRRLRREMETKRDKAVKDIILSLELGGTKDELMAMIANLEF